MDKQDIEMFDVLDEDGHKTGEKINRREAHEKGILHGASHIFIYRVKNHKIEVLLQRRSSNKDSFPNCLDTSSAGHVEAGMNFDDTALKELREELGIIVDASEIHYEYKMRYSSIDKFYEKIFNNQEIIYIYTLKKDIDISELKLQKEEVSDAVWLDGDEISDRLHHKDPEFCIFEDEYDKVLKIIKEREYNNL
ncbi:MAG: NUDIX domain-containing protein [Erysipelotrichaceae bacterium]|nr:NUDIX domain-containing protein [Erysipelotrichaceae bacterium]